MSKRTVGSGGGGGDRSCSGVIEQHDMRYNNQLGAEAPTILCGTDDKKSMAPTPRRHNDRHAC